MTKKESFKKAGKFILLGGITFLGLRTIDSFARDRGFIDKWTKKNSGYTDPYTASPFGSIVGPIRYRCDKCVYFKDGNKCTIVEGNIAPSAGCDWWIGISAEKAN